MHKPLRLIAFISLVVAVSLGCLSRLGQYGDTCSVYATSPDCQSGLQCGCLNSYGCYCVTSCGGDAGVFCGPNQTCDIGHNPATGATEHYCFPSSFDAG